MMEEPRVCFLSPAIEAAAPPAAGAPPPSGDPLAERIGKERLLFGIAPQRPVLLMGPAAAALAPHYRACYERVSVSEQLTLCEAPPPGGYGVVVIEAPGGEGAGARLAAGVRAVAPLLGPDGLLQLTAGNRFAPGRGGAPFGPGGYRRLLAAAGLPQMCELLPVAGGDGGESFCDTRFPLPRLEAASAGRRLLERLGVGRLRHPRYCYLAGRDRPPFSPLLAAFGRLRREGERAPLAVERFALRPRGAAVLLIAAADGERWAVRAAEHPEVTAAIARNGSALDRLHGMVDLGEMKRYLPRPLGQLRWRGALLGAESALRGHLALRVQHDPVREPATLRGAVGFARRLAGATSRTRHLCAATLSELLLPDVALLGRRLAHRQGAEALTRISEALRHHFGGRTLALAWSHGDYRYANLLVEPQSGRLAGVIEWDRSREQELVGVDLINLLLARECDRREGRIGTAVAALWEQLLRGDLQRLGLTTFIGEPFGLRRSDLPHLFLVTLLRLVERVAQPPAGPAEQRVVLAEALGTAANLLAALELGVE